MSPVPRLARNFYNSLARGFLFFSSFLFVFARPGQTSANKRLPHYESCFRNGSTGLSGSTEKKIFRNNNKLEYSMQQDE